jgi:hypothetical protein
MLFGNGNMSQVLLAFKFVIPFATWLLIGFFGFWLRRRVLIPSWPYLALYWLLQFPLLDTINGLFVTFFPSSGLWLLAGILSTSWRLYPLSAILQNLSVFTVSVVILSELTALLLTAGVEMDNKVIRFLLPLRNYGFLGLSAVALAGLARSSWLLTYIANLIK